jgi:hypothetical protein
MTLFDKESIIGLSLVVHQRGDIPTSDDGAAGATIACGNIEQVSASLTSSILYLFVSQLLLLLL